MATSETDRTPEELLASALRQIRTSRGVSQEQLATASTRAGVPMVQQTVARIETGQRTIRLNEAIALAEVFGFRLDDLLAMHGAVTGRSREDMYERWEMAVEESAKLSQRIGDLSQRADALRAELMEVEQEQGRLGLQRRRAEMLAESLRDALSRDPDGTDEQPPREGTPATDG